MCPAIVKLQVCEGIRVLWTHSLSLKLENYYCSQTFILCSKSRKNVNKQMENATKVIL